MDKTDIIIIGAGVVGLAIATELSEKFAGRSIILLEKHPKFGQETSSRNSEVIHAGIYYPAGSLKARLCVSGNRLLYAFCKKWNVPCRRMGKLIVAATDEEVETLDTLLSRGREIGVEDLQMINRNQAASYEPNIHAAAAILSPSTGVVDSHRLMSRLETLACKSGVTAAYRHEVTGIARSGSNTYTVSYRDAEQRQASIACQWLINSAGLSSDHMASLAGIDVDSAGYRIFPCKGEYFSISASKAKKISRLIYPPPFKDLRGLGIHVTKGLDGSVKLGPNAFYVEDLDCGVDPAHAQQFYTNIKAYLPFLEIDDLQPDMAGIRPKLQPPGTQIRDFVIRHETERGLNGLINLIGIESPGLTSCMSIARMVADIIEREA